MFTGEWIGAGITIGNLALNSVYVYRYKCFVLPLTRLSLVIYRVSLVMYSCTSAGFAFVMTERERERDGGGMPAHVLPLSDSMHYCQAVIPFRGSYVYVFRFRCTIVP